MVYKELQFMEYLFEGKPNQWATISIGRVDPLTIMINYDTRISTEEKVTLKLGGKIVMNQDYEGFDTVFGNINGREVCFYSRGSGFCLAALSKMTWKGEE